MLPGSQLDVVETRGRTGLAKPVSTEKKSVCHIASGDRWAGAEVQLANLLRGLARREEFILSVILLNEGRLAEEARRCGVEVKIILEDQKSFLEIFMEANRYLKGKGVRILHSHRYKENFLAALLAWRCRVPIVVRALQGLPEPYEGLKRYKQWLIHFLDRVLARYGTDCVVSASDELRNELIRYVKPQKVVTVRNAVDTGQVHTSLSVADAKKRLGIPENCRVVGAAARLEPIKRLDIFLSAASRIAVQLPDTRFVIVGDGSEEVRLRALAETRGIQDRVLFLGHRADVYDVLRAFDILVLCSDHEGLPNILLEALCLGVVVVARRVGGVPEVIQNGVNGVLVESSSPSDLAEACLEVLADGRRRSVLALRGVDFVAEKFSAQQAAAKVAELYCSLCGAR